jgi:23S rRNA pseudouridine2604 synthase
MRINRWLSAQGHGSRREADAWIRDGRVTVNGVPAELGMEIGPEDHVSLDGRALHARRVAPIVIAYNKPVGVECTSDRAVPNNIIAAVNFPERIVHVGRLDVMSEGLILLTNQGDIVQTLLSAENGHEREYLVTFSKAVSDTEVRKLSAGVDIGDERGPTLPCKVERVTQDTLRLILIEGRNRQIRRMAEAIGNHVRRLERVRIMHIRLGQIPRGHWRHLTPSELRELYQRLRLERPAGALRSETPERPRPKAGPRDAHGAPQDGSRKGPPGRVSARPSGARDERPSRPSGPRDERPTRSSAPRDERPSRPSGPRNDRPSAPRTGSRRGPGQS